MWGDGYTELFFLDEVIAFAAGHRPCFECRRKDAERFALLFAGKKKRASAPADGRRASRRAAWLVWPNVPIVRKLDVTFLTAR